MSASDKGILADTELLTLFIFMLPFSTVWWSGLWNIRMCPCPYRPADEIRSSSFLKTRCRILRRMWIDNRTSLTWQCCKRGSVMKALLCHVPEYLYSVHRATNRPSHPVWSSKCREPECGQSDLRYTSPSYCLVWHNQVHVSSQDLINLSLTWSCGMLVL